MEERIYLLEAIGLTKIMQGVKVLNSVSFQLEAGTVHGLIFEKGISREMMTYLFGVHSKSEGTILVNGRSFVFSNPQQALESGIALINQNPQIVPKHTVMDEIWMGRFPKKMYDETLKIFRDLEINIDPKSKFSSLSATQMQMVYIAKAVSYNAKILIINEFPPSININEVSQLFKIIIRLKVQRYGIIYVSHILQEAVQISDVISVIKDGRVVSTTLANEISNKRKL